MVKLSAAGGMAEIIKHGIEILDLRAPAPGRHPKPRSLKTRRLSSDLITEALSGPKGGDVGSGRDETPLIARCTI